MVSRTSWFLPSECKWNAAQVQKDQTDLVTSSFLVRPLAIMGSGLVDQSWKPYPDVPADVAMIGGIGLLWD